MGPFFVVFFFFNVFLFHAFYCSSLCSFTTKRVSYFSYFFIFLFFYFFFKFLLVLPQRETLAGPVMIPWLNSLLSETAIVGETKIGLSTGEAEHRERRKGGCISGSALPKKKRLVKYGQVVK